MVSIKRKDGNDMVTVTNLKSIINGKELVDISCISTDTKPTRFANGSMCLEMDTGKIYAFNETASTWVEVA